MTYDEATYKIEAILSELEQAEALPMEEYQKRAKEAKELIHFCQQQLTNWEEKISEVIQD